MLADKSEAFAGIRDGVPIIVGYVPAGVTFGILAAEAGIRIGDTLGFSGLVFAGASQYMALDLLAAGSSIIQIVVATFLLNFRHFLMSAAVAPKLHEPRIAVRALIAYGVTDETFAISSTRVSVTPAYLAGLQTTAWLSWLTGTIAGYFAGTLLPPELGTAMGVALYALFAALLSPILQKSFRMIIPAGLAAGLHVVLVRTLSMAPGWAFVISIILAGVLGSIIIRDERS